MHEFFGTASVDVEAPARAVFDLLTDVDRLPEWNRAIEEVQERPATLAPGAEWRVKMRPPRTPSWGSVSHVEVLDRERLRFAYETRNADGNPSTAHWTWEVVDADGAAHVTVTWDVTLRTLDRQLLGGPIRRRQLAKEVPASLRALRDAVVVTGSATSDASG